MINCPIFSAVPPVLRDGVPERRRPHVPHPANGQIRDGPSEVLRSGNPARSQVPAPKGHRLQVLKMISFKKAKSLKVVFDIVRDLFRTELFLSGPVA